MARIRKGRLLGLCTGTTCTSSESPCSRDGASPVEISTPVSVHPMPSLGSDLSKHEQVHVSEPDLASSNLSGCGPSKEEQVKQHPVPEIKRRKNRELCAMRGVYFKTMKWQAAIKVGKKQIHLGTVGSQKEAAHLYDRAAFMLGRETNFELSLEEKQELRAISWSDFLTMKRNEINNKKTQTRNGTAT